MPHGIESTLQMDATVTKVVDPAQPADEFNAPKSGDRLVAVRLRLRNTGTDTYSDSPSNGMKA